jgi:hypothetical protein
MTIMMMIMQAGLVAGGGRRQRGAELGSGDSHLVVGNFLMMPVNVSAFSGRL